VKGSGVDGAVASIGGEEFWERVAEIIANEGGDNIFVAERDNEEMACPSGVEIVLPAGTRVSARLWISRGQCSILLVLHQCRNHRVLVRDLMVQDHGQLLVVCCVAEGVRDLANWRDVDERDTGGGTVEFFFVVKSHSVCHDDNHGRIGWG